MIRSEAELLTLALSLGAANVGGPLSAQERRLIATVEEPSSAKRLTESVRTSILRGEDPLGDLFLKIRDAAVRREDGAVYTPESLLEPMVVWTLEQKPDRLVDPGVGSGRFLRRALQLAPGLEAIAIDLDPLATLMTRANVAVLGLENVRVLNEDYTRVKLPRIPGRTAFLGNPPYVRHHGLSAKAKSLAKLAAASLGHDLSGLAGLHAHFFLYTASFARPNDVGCFVTSSEWLDVNYGEIIRKLLLNDLGGESIHVVEPSALPFDGAQTTAVIATFRVGTAPDPLRMQDVTDLADLSPLAETGRPINRQRLIETRRWSGLLRAPEAIPEGFVELGELCRVHRGTVTGANATWVHRQGVDLPASVLYPSITRARELFAAGDVLTTAEALKLVVDIPSELDELETADRRRIQRFIREAKRAGVDRGYVAAHRRAWWSVGLKQPAPILATYMARRPPTFVVNEVSARHINIAHGLYPRQELSTYQVTRLAESLRLRAGLTGGRVYAGGLTKFEPREMERLLVPNLAILSSHESLSAGMVS